MRKLCRDLLWLLSGGIEKTIRQRNELKTQLAATHVALDKSRNRERFLEEKFNRVSLAQPLPFIMLNTLPKSGSVYLTESLRLGLGIPVKQISPGYVPMDLADYRRLAEGAIGNTIAQAHLDANPTNLRLLAEYSPRMVLHLRDPRQALLSWIHHVKGFAARGRLSDALVTPLPPVALFNQNFSALIDWHLAHHFINLLDWMERWLAHAESGLRPNLLISQFEDLRHDAHATIYRLLDFYGIPRWMYDPQDIPHTHETHFRKGELDEWREVFNPVQQSICAEFMAGYPRLNRLYGGEENFQNNRKELPANQSVVVERNGYAECVSVKNA